MTVYVDDMYQHPMGSFGRMKMSHMIADTENELHAMADKIGVQRKWYQGDHYDIALSRRVLAMAVGAQEITLRQCAFMAVYRRRTGGPLPKPEEAESVYKAWRQTRQPAQAE
jgi:hypothetical protein